jgi:uncharacterized membrane protein
MKMFHPAALVWIFQQPHFSFPQGAANEQIFLRWTHLIAGIIWIGLLYFFNLVGTPAMQSLDPATRMKIYPVLMSRAMSWFRWSALVTVIMGLRYFLILLQADAANAGNPGLTWRWFGYWFLVWMVAYALIFPLQIPRKGPLDNGWFRAVAIAIIVIAASWIVLDLNGSRSSSNAHLSISVGGGLGLIMLMNAWGVVWRVQKKMIAWTRANSEQGTPIPPEAQHLMKWALIASRTAFWISFPMLFFMGAAEHYPFLSSLAN